MYNPTRPPPLPGQMSIMGGMRQPAKQHPYGQPPFGGPGGMVSPPPMMPPQAAQPPQGMMPPQPQQGIQPQAQPPIMISSSVPQYQPAIMGQQMGQALSNQQGFRGMIGDWRDDRPDRQAFEGNRAGWKDARADWRDNRPDFGTYRSGGYPQPSPVTGGIAPMGGLFGKRGK